MFPDTPHSALLWSAALSTPWAILPAKLAVILSVLQRHASGARLTADEIQAAIETRAPTPALGAGSVAVIPIFGTLVPRANLMTQTSGATSAQAVAQSVRAALNDPNYSAIVLDVDSPGGAVTGIAELADEIYKSRGAKPIIAVANHLAASAAYWVATAADELVVSPSAEVGSIGVFAAHEDLSAALDRDGVKTTLISAGRYKTEASPLQPLTEEARAAIQSRVDEYYDAFVKAVARGRGVSVADVRGGFGEGRVVGAREAVRLGMADRVGTLDSVLADLTRGRRPSAARADVGDQRELRQRRLRLAEKESD